ncbi:uncharacterized protein CELE_C17E7.13 [Caenorhabditis elegans]|uniref:Uncharacterized protein n=1 Tax=Caenorhabditis elegans TaxID=6239 RepID=Q965M9_CAEEL|nr:Uncharacterized protein CELE_C17E7.13 [Caenorhabditis elegans]CCD64879.1 Uncharacterized protein CELE_C17E7.13 [Caenorhabditis elegans]|eukprot:NP_504071.1 Uncharacterized protein CELE_C17E7.13 [Caenorhabditis elegans]
MKLFQVLLSCTIILQFSTLEYSRFGKVIEVHFEIIDVKTGRQEFQFSNKADARTFRQIAHAKALMILYWQQVAEAEHRVSENLNLKLTVRWMNCSVLDMYANRLPMERYTVSEKNREIHLLDFDCVPDDLRAWCTEDPGRDIHVLYVLEKQFGHVVEMKFICDPAIVKDQVENYVLLIYGFIAAALILVSLCVVSRARKRRKPNVSISNISEHREKANFLPVPEHFQQKPEENGMMVSRVLESEVRISWPTVQFFKYAEQSQTNQTVNDAESSISTPKRDQEQN